MLLAELGLPNLTSAHVSGVTAIPALARDVLACFLRSPQGVDSLEGIARFRLEQHAVLVTVEQVEEALGWLVVQGYLEQHTSLGASAPYYKLNESKVSDAQRVVGTTEDSTTKRDADVARAGSERSSLHVSLSCGQAWLDAVLLVYHLRHPARADDLPGFCRGRGWIESALSNAPPAESDVLLAEQTAAAAGEALSIAMAAETNGDRLLQLVRTLGLSSLELRVLLLCLAPELTGKYQILFGMFHDDLSRRTPSLGLICEILGEPVAIRSELNRSSALLRWRLLDCGTQLPYADEPVRVDHALLCWLLGDDSALTWDGMIAPLVSPLPSAPYDACSSEVLSRAMRSGKWLVLQCDEPNAAQAVTCGDRLYKVELARALSWRDVGTAQLATRLVRALLLMGGVPLFLHTPQLDAAAHSLSLELIEAVGQHVPSGVVVVSDLQLVVPALARVSYEVLRQQAPDWLASAAALLEEAQCARVPLSARDAEWLALTFPLSRSALPTVLAMTRAACPDLHDSDQVRAALLLACRRLCVVEPPTLARRVEPVLSLDDLVLPEDRHAQLMEIVEHVRCAPQVLKHWGFEAQLPYGRGVAALFHGASGTGKTMAAQAIARALGTDLYVVDLSRVVSKYIGESEKNLDAIFREAERAGAVLLFDEADALFGKRSEIKDAHDRYANIEVAYLLQRIEAYAGLAILTTNYRQNLDQAFLRRLRFLVEFPKPDAAAREQIWRKCLPSSAPLAHDINLKLLARRLELTGGNIRQITLRAAFSAAAEGTVEIQMQHLIKASLAELRKLGMPTAERALAELDASVKGMTARAV